MRELKLNPIDFKSLFLAGLGVLSIYSAEFLPHWSVREKLKPAIVRHTSQNSCSAAPPRFERFDKQLCKAPGAKSGVAEGLGGRP